MSDYDDDEQPPYDLDFYQRLNQVNSVAGAPAVLPEQYAAIAADAEKLNVNVASELLYDNSPVARRIAGHMMGDLSKVLDITHRQAVWRQWCPDHDSAGPDTVASLYVVSRDDSCENPNALIALSDIGQLPEVMAGMFDGDTTCHARVTRRCREYDATHRFAVKRGEYICVFLSCRECLQHIRSGAGFNDDYTGPDHDWYDDRTVEVPDADEPWTF